LVAGLLILAACGGGSDGVAAPAAASVAGAAEPAAPGPPPPASGVAANPVAQTTVPASPAAVAQPPAPAKSVSAAHRRVAAPAGSRPSAPVAPNTATVRGAARPAVATPSAAAPAPAAAAAGDGVTDVGVTRDVIKLGVINMHGKALGNILIDPQVAGMRATASSINDRGGILGRRLEIVDCDDGPGEVSRAKACIRHLVEQDNVFGLLTSVTWASASLHDDLAQYRRPLVGGWAYSQTEWQDPWMFPTHMSMLHEALANANWVRDTIRPKTYGLLCLTSPEMQLACGNVSKVLDVAGIKLVKKLDVAISETTMSPQILAMRAANPDHIVHYVINAATVGKFMVEAAQQGYYPPLGISGNHLAAEVLGGLIGNFQVNRYWINTTYKLWGPEYMAVMRKYAPGTIGRNHHILQAGYVGTNIFAQAAKEVGANLTRDRLVAELGSGRIWKSDASLDQRFSWSPAERGEAYNGELGNGREFM
jgi:ABC-type branched-subunit amino acid transport system substrate-binding protein